MKALHRLDEVCDVVMGQAPSGEAYNTEGRGWPLIAGAGDFGETKPAAKKFTTEASKLSQNGDIVLGIRASIGEKVLADGVYCLGRGVAALRARSSLESRFLWHWLAHSAPCLAAKAKGATFKQVNREDIAELEIELPPLAEQRRIAEVLDKAEALRAKRHAALAQHDSLTQSLFLDLFGDPATNPKGWLMKKCGDVANIGSGAGFPLNYQGLSGGEFPFYKVSDMNTQGNETSMQVARHTISEDVRRVLRAETFPPGAIIFPKIGAAIATNKKRLLVRDSCIDNNVMAVAPGDPIESRYLFSLLSFKDISDFAQKGNPPSMRKSDVERWEIPIPPLDLQREFARRVAAVEKLKTAQRAALAELDALFASLQHRAFRGEL